jgi:MSHA biogenesis protein MshE
LHTNDALSTPIRLLDMGVPRYMVALSIQMVLAQRLVRVICENCSAPHERLAARASVAQGGTRRPGGCVQYRRGQGCSHCANTGYQGRQAVYEILDMNNALVEAVNRGDPNEFMQIGREQMAGNTLRRDAVRLVMSGRTTIEEAMRISTQLDE